MINRYRGKRINLDQRHRKDFNKFIEENFLNLSKDMPITVQKKPSRHQI